MQRDIPSHIWYFWTHTMEKLDTNGDLYEPIPQVLQDLCDFFHFGFTFVYKADHTGALTLSDYYGVYENTHRREHFHIGEALGEQATRELCGRKSVIYDSKTEKDPLEQKLSAYFGANTLILIPLLDTAGSLIALVGAADRRGRTRQGAVDIAYSYSILRVIANYIKLQLYQARIESTEQALRSIIDNMGLDVFVNDFYTHEILYINQSMAKYHGGPQEMLGQKFWQALTGANSHFGPCPHEKLVDAAGVPTGVYSWDFQRELDGAWLRVYSSAFPWVDGRLAQVVSSVDITENKRNEDTIRRMALYDALTGLPNRRKLLQDWEEPLDSGGAIPEGYLLFFDLDGFKAVNDSLGHSAGDELLREIAAFLEQNALTAGQSYRHAGDEFVILCPREPVERLEETVALLLDRFSRPWDLREASILCNASFGIAAAPEDATSADGLLYRADKAMYRAKQPGGSACFYAGGEFLSPAEYYQKANKIRQ